MTKTQNSFEKSCLFFGLFFFFLLLLRFNRVLLRDTGSVFTETYLQWASLVMCSFHFISHVQCEISILNIKRCVSQHCISLIGTHFNAVKFYKIYFLNKYILCTYSIWMLHNSLYAIY